MTKPRHILFIITDGFQALDLFGPLDAFAAANDFAGDAYRWSLVSLSGRTVRAEAGVPLIADMSLEDIDELEPVDTLIFTGGRGPRTATLGETEREALARAARSARRTASVCTGTFLLAQIGTADGRRVVTHWRYARQLAESFPALSVDPDALYVKDGPVWSSAGITAGIDMAMAMIAEDCGSAVCAAVARHLVVYLRRPGSQAQFSEPLAAQDHAAGRIGGALQWMSDHLDEPLNTQILADKCAMSPRHFTRLFRRTMNTAPAHYIERLRLDRARLLLAEPGARIDRVAAAVGFAGADSFRRAFERRFGVSPADYRRRFTIGEAATAPPPDEVV